MRGSARRTAVALALAVVLGASSGCQLVGGDDAADGAQPVEPTAATPAELAVQSQFTRDGTFQSHLPVDGVSGMDFVYTLYPTKATPRTNEWYPKGKKYFSFTFQAYDLDSGLRAPFSTKRKVYLQRIKVTSATITADGGRTQRPYRLDAVASKITFDPEPVTTDRGMLVTSPKGAFEVRNQEIGRMSPDTRGVRLTFTATVFVERTAGSGDFVERTVRQVVPIAIFESDDPTSVADIPVNAN